MKQKVVIKVSLNDQKSRTKAIKTAVGVDGVLQATLQQEKNQIEVTGDDIDVVLLTTLLRKSMKFAEVVSVSPVEKEEEEKKKEEEKKEAEALKYVWHPFVNPPAYYYQSSEPGYVYTHQYQDPSCSIM